MNYSCQKDTDLIRYTFYDVIVLLAYLQEKLFVYCIPIFLLPGNKSHPASTKPQFSQGDPRLKYAVKKLDPRIHFALVCGAVVRREYMCVCVYVCM